MAAVAAEAGITKPILYRVFGDRQGLFAALAERHTSALLEVLRAELRGSRDPRIRTRALVSAYLGFVQADPAVYRFLVQRAATEEPAVRSHVAGFVRRLGEEIGAGLAVQTGLPATVAAVWGSALVGAVQAGVDRWLTDPGCAAETLIDELTRVLCDGWAASAGDQAQV